MIRTKLVEGGVREAPSSCLPAPQCVLRAHQAHSAPWGWNGLPPGADAPLHHP